MTNLVVRDRLAAARGFVFDMDGTLVLGDRNSHGLRPLPGALEITQWAARCGRPYLVFTNGTNRTPAAYARIMRELGFPLLDEAMLTPASSAVRVLLRAGHQRVMLLGGPALAEPLREARLDVVAPGDGDTVAGLAGTGAGYGAPELGRDWLVPPLPREFDDPAEAEWTGARRTPHPAACFTEPVRLARPLEDYPFTRTYIKATGEPRPRDGEPFWAAADRAIASLAWRYQEIATNHMIASNRPGELVRLLLGLA